MKLASVLIVSLALLVFAAQSEAQANGQGGPAMKVQVTAADKARIVKLEKEYNFAKTALAKAPKDEKAKKRFVTIGALFGHESMMSPALDRKVKYRQALRVYREVLKVDPTNPVAKSDSEMIIKIYKSLGRPVPID